MTTAFADANRLYDAGKLREAVGRYADALAEDPTDPNVLYRAVLTLVAMRDYRGAQHFLTTLLSSIDTSATSPRLMAEFYYNLGCCHEMNGDWHRAKFAHLTSLKYEDTILPRVNLGSISYRNGEPEKGRQWHRSAIQPITDDPAVLAGRSFVHLLHGDYPKGFAEYEHRWELPSVRMQSMVPDWGSRWDGSDLNGQSLLVISEQGVGDVLMMLRYLPMLEAKGAHVTLIVHAGLKRLVQHSFPTVTVLARDDVLDAKPDAWVHVMSLPGVLGTTVDTIPPALTLTPPPDGPRLNVPGFRVGLVTQGNALHMSDKDRSAPRGTFDALSKIPGVSVVSLHEADLTKTYGVKDFADTASVLTQLDLVIAIDSAVAHCAGNLGIPVWLCPPCAPEWRWGLGEQAPWYPTTHRLYRRRHVHDWPSVVERITHDLTTR